MKGMENVEKETCVRFVPWTHQQDYIDIQQKSGWEPFPGKFDSMMWLIAPLEAVWMRCEILS